MTRACVLALALAGGLARVVVGAVPPSPESFLGFRVGEDRKLADWTQAVAYFHALAAASPRVRVEDVGKTSEGRPFLVVTITSEANMARLEEIRLQNLRLADPRGLGDAEAESLVANGKTIVALNHGIHSDEVAASQTALETAYTLATAEDAATRQILDETVILMLPSHNPDGMQRVTEWYRKTLGTPFEGEDPPFLYQKYTGHDNNRDWYMFTQAETRLTVEHLYDRWHPQIVHDLHQMGYRGARIFLPPYLDPWEPNVDPALRTAVAALGSYMAAVLTGEGKAGCRDSRRLRRLVAVPRLSPHPRRHPPAERVRVRASRDADRRSLRRPRGGERLRLQARIVELPAAVDGRPLAAARHRRLPALRHAGASRSMRPATVTTGCATSSR